MKNCKNGVQRAQKVIFSIVTLGQSVTQNAAADLDSEFSQFLSFLPNHILEKRMADKKYFGAAKLGDDTGTVFASRQPRGAALKAATRGHTDIRLRERGTNRVHVFKGWREQVEAPSGAPSWLGGKVWKSNVKKLWC